MFVLLQKVLPKKALSALFGIGSRLQLGHLSSLIIRLYIYVYKVDMSDAKIKDPSAYSTFNQFFTRELAKNARPQPFDRRKVTSPADGTISRSGDIKGEILIQAKGRQYSLKSLLGDEKLVALFSNGTYHTIYLAPYNYHRIHMPSDGEARFLRYTPGHLFSVNKNTVNNINNLFCVNERASIVYESDSGYFALVMVGALNVGSFEVYTHLQSRFVNRPKHNLKPDTLHPLQSEKILRGTELGRFNMGSTVILLTSRNFASWEKFETHEKSISVGAELGGTINL
jgi:phosphatidylserine decarboxylase